MGPGWKFIFARRGWSAGISVGKYLDRFCLAGLQVAAKKTVRGRCEVDILDVVFGLMRKMAATLG